MKVFYQQAHYVKLLGVVAFIFFCLFVSDTAAQAQVFPSSILQFYEVEGGESLESGALISKDIESNTYRPAVQNSSTSAAFFGVVIREPRLYFRQNASPTAVPIERGGVVVILVSDIYGEIVAGDSIALSPFPGVGAKLTESNRSNSQIVGVAQGRFPNQEAEIVTTDNGEQVSIGQVAVDLEGKDAALADTASSAATAEEAKYGFYLKILQYVAAIAVAVGSIYIAYSNFMGTLKESVVSIGRNPLAQRSIHRMVIYNSILLLLILSIGFSISFAILTL